MILASNIKMYVIIGIFAVLSIFLIVFFIVPPLHDIKSNTDEIMLDQSNIVSLGAENNNLYDFKKKYEGYKPDLEKIDNFFIDSQNPIAFIEFMDKVASDSNVNITVDLTVPQKGTLANTQFVDFQIHVRGDLSNVIRFSKKLETGPYLITIQNVTINKSNPDFANEKYQTNPVNAEFKIEVAAK